MAKTACSSKQALSRYYLGAPLPQGSVPVFWCFCDCWAPLRDVSGTQNGRFHNFLSFSKPTPRAAESVGDAEAVDFPRPQSWFKISPFLLLLMNSSSPKPSSLLNTCSALGTWVVPLQSTPASSYGERGLGFFGTEAKIKLKIT